MKRLVSVIIPNFNGLELLRICLSSLRKQTFKNFEVILVDNGSEDGSVEYLEKFKVQSSKFKVIELDKNYGFAKAVNEGIKKSKGKYLMLLNNDTEVDKRCIEYLVKSADKHREVGFISAKVLNFYKRDIIDNAGDYLDSVGHLLTRGLGEVDGKKYKVGCYIFLATGSGCLIKREVFKRIGLFDEDYVFYMEDADFFFRAQLAGFKGWFEPKAKIYHMRMATSSKNLPLAEYLVFRNMMVTVIKNFPQGIFIKNFNWLKIILTNINTVRYLIFKGLFWQGFKAQIYIIFNLPKILEKRARIQKGKKVSDQYLIDNILDKKITMPKL